MAKLNDVASGVVGGDVDVSEDTESAPGSSGGTAVDMVVAHRKQVRERVEKLDALERERRSQADTAPNHILTDPA